MHRIAPTLAVLALAPAVAHAAFVDGVETFDGTTLDTATWEQLNLVDPTRLTQDDAIRLNGSFPGGWIDYVTREQQVGVGQSLRADITLNDIGGSVYLILTNNSTGTGGGIGGITIQDTALLGVFLTANTDVGAQVGGSGSTTGQVLREGSTPLGEAFTYEIARLDSTSARYSILDLATKTTLFTQTLSFGGIPDNLFIALAVNGGDATFDNVAIRAIGDGPVIPTPAAVGAGMLLLGGLITRRRR